MREQSMDNPARCTLVLTTVSPSPMQIVLIFPTFFFLTELINFLEFDFYADIFKLKVVQGKTYLLRMVNAGADDHLFFKIGGHVFTVVAVDARYTRPYKTDVIVISPGQSADVLFTANQPCGSYYMAARAYSPTPALQFANGTTTGIVEYKGTKSRTPMMPALPGFRDTETAHKFLSSLTSLTTRNKPHWVPVPRKVDEKMFITFGLGLEPCGGNNSCANPLGSQYRFSGNFNNVSFQHPTSLSMLEANGTTTSVYS